MARWSVKKALESARKVDRRKVDAMTDADLKRQIEANPDAAPDLTEALEAGEFRIVRSPDVAAIRARTGLSQRAFADRFGLPLRQVQEWEQKRKIPSGAARTLLGVIEREPEVVARTVAAMARRETGERR